MPIAAVHALSLAAPGPLVRALWRARVFAVLAIGHAAAAQAVTTIAGGTPGGAATGQLVGLFTVFLPVFVLVLAIWHLGRVLICDRGPDRLARALADLSAALRDAERLAHGVLVLAVLTALTAAAMYFKALIPEIRPFDLDPALAALDRALHGGVDPWRLLWPAFGNAPALFVVNAAYQGWIVLLYFLLFHAAFAGAAAAAPARRFLIAFALAWIVAGNLLATLLSSAGPVYYERLGHGADFAPLMAALDLAGQRVTIHALALHEMLWRSYTDGNSIGISAMPSMHLATSTLMALYVARVAPWARWPMVAFVAVIMAGSVLLGWHYAVDGYAGIALALGVWHLAGWLERAFPAVARGGVDGWTPGGATGREPQACLVSGVGIEPTAR